MNSEKKTGGFSFFTLWFGAAVSLAEIMTGSLTAPLGIKKGIAAIILGHLAGCTILALTGVIGFREGKPSLIASRISMGRYGSYMISVFNILQLVGWTAIMLIQCARSLQSVTERLFGIGSFSVLVLTVGVLVAVWALNINKGINIVNNVAVVMLAALSIVMLVLSLKGGGAKSVQGSISFGAAFELSIVMPLSWVPLISDYTRSGKSLSGCFSGSFAGYFIGSVLMYTIGLVSSVYTGNPDPVGIMAHLDTGYSALLIVILATVTTTFLDVYSSVLTTLNLVPKLSKKMLIIVFTALGTLLALFFPMEQYENFLYLIGSLFAPAFTVILVDYFLYKKDRSRHNVNISGVTSAILGTLAYYAVNRFDLPVGDSIPAILITCIIYAVMRAAANKFKYGGETYVGQNS